jgi:hypothetical protein
MDLYEGGWLLNDVDELTEAITEEQYCQNGASILKFETGMEREADIRESFLNRTGRFHFVTEAVWTDATGDNIKYYQVIVGIITATDGASNLLTCSNVSSYSFSGRRFPTTAGRGRNPQKSCV